MACGVATLGSDSGEIPHVLDEAGLIFPEGDAEALATRLQALLDDETLRHSFGRRGRERVLAHFTQKQIAAATVEVYRSIMQTSPSSGS